MVKSENEYAKVLYKRSYTSYSKTCTTLSNHTKITKASNNVRMKPSQQKVLYNEEGKIKRDLSIETDLCRIRRRFKQKLMKLSNVDTKSAYTTRVPISAKSKYSNYTEESLVEEFKSNDSGCGDQNTAPYEANQYFVNKEDLMYDNLTALFNTWVKQLLQDKELKSLIHNAFETAMQKSESKKIGKSSSCTTYVLEDNTRKSLSSSERYSDKKQTNSSDHSSYLLPSSYTVPMVYKTLRLISTLSIPKNLHKRKRRGRRNKTKTFRMKKRPHKKLLVTLIQPKKDFDKESDINIDMIEVSTKSWLRRCVNIDDKDYKGKANTEKPYIVFRADSPRPIQINNPCKAAAEVAEIKMVKNNDLLFVTKSLLHGIYGKSVNTNTTTTSKKNNYGTDSSRHTIKRSRERGDAVLKKHANTEYSCHKTSIKTSTILQETDQSDPMVTIDFLTHNICYPAGLFKERQSVKKIAKKDMAILCKRLRSYPRLANSKKYDINQRKDYTHLYKRVKKQTRTKGNVINNLQTVFNYFVNETHKNIELDLHLSLSPNNDESVKTKSRKQKENNVTTASEAVSDVTSITEEIVKKKYLKAETTVPKTIARPDDAIQKVDKINKILPKIIPLLDSAASKTEYVFKMDSSTAKPDATILSNSKDQASMTIDLGLKDEINEIKLALMNITHLVNSYFLWEHNTKRLDNSLQSVRPKEQTPPKLTKKVSPGIKVTTNKKKYSGIKLSKEGRHSNSTQMERKPNPKRTKHSFEDNVMNTLASYRIIESESLIEITNMTTCSGQQGLNSKDVAVTCSLPQARSLYEVSCEEAQEQFTYYSKIPAKYNLGLQAAKVAKQHDIIGAQRSSFEATAAHAEPSILDSKPAFQTVECNTSANNIFSERVIENKSSKTNNFSFRNYLKNNISCRPSFGSASDRKRVKTRPSRLRSRSCTKNVFVCQNNPQTKYDSPNTSFECQKSFDTDKSAGTKNSVSCQKSTGTKSDALTNNSFGCQSSRNTAVTKKNFSCQMSSEWNKNDCQKSVESKSIVTSNNTRISFGCQKAVDMVSDGTKHSNQNHQNYDTPKTSFCCQSSFETKTDGTSFTDDRFKQKIMETSSSRNADGSDLQTTKVSNSNHINSSMYNSDHRPTEAKTNIIKKNEEKSGVNFHIKQSDAFDQTTFTLNLGDDSDSKLKSASSIATRRIRKYTIWFLVVFILLMVLFSYIVLNRELIKKLLVGPTKNYNKHISYSKLNLSELGF